MKNILLFVVAILLINCSDKEKLVANYPLNGNLNDYTLARVAQYKGDVNFVKTNHTKGLRYDSKKQISYITLPGIVLNSKEYTISAIINIKSFKHNNSLFFYGSKNESWGNSGLWIYTDKNKITAFQEKQVLNKKKYLNKEKYNNVFTSCKDLESNKDYFITVTYKNKSLFIYIDVKLYANYKNVKPFKNKDRKFVVGIANDPKKGGKFQLDGIIDEIKIFNKSLTNKEITDLYKTYQKK